MAANAGAPPKFRLRALRKVSGWTYPRLHYRRRTHPGPMSAMVTVAAMAEQITHLPRRVTSS